MAAMGDGDGSGGRWGVADPELLAAIAALTRELADVKAQLNEQRRGPAHAPSGITFADLGERYAAWQLERVGTLPDGRPKIRRKSWSHTGASHMRHLVRFFGPMAVEAITLNDGREYQRKRLGEKTLIGDRDVAPGTVNLEIDTARAACNWALKKAQLIRRNPFDGLEALAVEVTRDFFVSEDDVLRILEHATQLLRFFLIILFETGMRRDELRLLSRKHELDLESDPPLITLPAWRVKEGRNGKTKVIPVTDLAAKAFAALRRYYEAIGVDDSVRVFPNPRGGGEAMPDSTLHDHFARAREAAGVYGPRDQNVWLHTMRHSFASLMAREGMPLFILMKILGHSDKRTTDRYTNMAPGFVDAALDYMNRRHGPRQVPDADEPTPLRREIADYVRPKR